jgi:hypothetical protein
MRPARCWCWPAPAAGKTSVITEKIAHLIRSGLCRQRDRRDHLHQQGRWREMRERVGHQAAREGRPRRGPFEGLTVCTFHALGLRILQIEHAAWGCARLLGVRRRCTARRSRTCCRRQPSRCGRGDARHGVAAPRTPGLSPEQARRGTQRARARGRRAVRRYQQRLRAFNAVDFDDLIRLPVQLLESTESARPAGAKLGYLLVDECQDTNDAQYRCSSAGRASAACSPAWATTTSRSTPGAAPIRTTCCSWAGLPGAEDRQARAELPLLAAHPARGQRADRATTRTSTRRSCGATSPMASRSASGNAAMPTTRPRRSPARSPSSPVSAARRGATSASCSAATTSRARWRRRCSCCACPTT